MSLMSMNTNPLTVNREKLIYFNSFYFISLYSNSFFQVKEKNEGDDEDMSQYDRPQEDEATLFGYVQKAMK